MKRPGLLLLLVCAFVLLLQLPLIYRVALLWLFVVCVFVSVGYVFVVLYVLKRWLMK